MIVYIALGNSDDKLTQRDWSCFMFDVRQCIADTTAGVHGEWVSYPDSIYQNAAWCIEIVEDEVPELKGVLAAIAQQYRQDSIAWTVGEPTEFLGATKKGARR